MGNRLKDELIEAIKEKENTEKNRVNNDGWRLNYHLMPPVGWLNDPNGLCEFNGVYHVFYQYSPFNPEGGEKYWGHYNSEDFINWKQEEVALCPDTEFDRDGVYSGSALMSEGKIYFYYTGNVKHVGEYDYIYEGRGHNIILVTSEDGSKFSEKKVLLKNKDYPENMSCHVRDPKVWKSKAKYYMVLGARTKDDIGQAIVYSSEDKENWTLINIVKSDKKLGYMWECPDLFELEGKQVLITCPQGIEADRIDFNNIYQCGYFIIEGDITTKDYKLSDFRELDRGFDIYAPQTFLDSKGRRILIGWMGIPDAVYINPTVEKGWQHALTIPRELKLINNKIYQIPIKELERLRINHRRFDVQDKIIVGNSYELILDFETEVKALKIKLRKDVTLSYSKANNIFELSLGASGYGRGTRALKINGIKNLRIFSDTSSLEIFLNGGEETFTTRVYDDLNYSEVLIEGKEIRGTVELYDLDKFQYK